MPESATIQSNRSLLLIFLFSGTLFLSASLMFVLQPLFGKLLLPLLGGSPAVWNTCMVFYQMLLFVGYLYAHFLSTKLSQLRQIQVHGVLILISLIALPVALPEIMTPPTDSNPTFWLVGVLFVSIGLPFFLISTTSPLIQKWFSHVGHHTSHDPYYLYAASNIGSLLALLSYPFIIEPNIGLAEQQSSWSIVYLLLLAAIIACGAYFYRNYQAVGDSEEDESFIPVEAPSLVTKAHWLALAFVPSSLLLGLTNFVSTDIAAAPLLWIIPLTLYLLSFVLVFSRWAESIQRIALWVQPVVLLPFLAFSFINPALLPYWFDLILHLTSFFLAVMVCHGELAKHRPHTQYLTLFYLIMSFAGMLGGMFNSFVAPFIFNGIYEYPLMIIAALLLRPSPEGESWLDKAEHAAFPALLILFVLVAYLAAVDLGSYMDHIGTALILFVGLSYAYRKQAVSLALLTGIIIFSIVGLRNIMSNTVYKERTFFGVLSVRDSVLMDEQGKPERYKEIFHGTTKHGAQRTGKHSQEPLTYYSRPGPMGQLFKIYDNENAQWKVGVVGLGAGALACYAKPKQEWKFYEIDPVVVDVAKDPQYFSYLSQCTPKAAMIVGDARLSLQEENKGQFDLLVIDAFSSDSVPTHLLTQEALHLYMSKLSPKGILAFHITNRHLAIKKVLADHARQLNYAALIQEFKPKKAAPLVVATDWFVFAKTEQSLAPLYQKGLARWQKPALYFDMQHWTDDFTNVVGIWK
ncbi:MAG: fused MFS/spermidine synthase [Methyloprofundus sp.]|nr:fused MFS/spermidine synthase [Methyloprofundus sp.]